MVSDHPKSGSVEAKLLESAGCGQLTTVAQLGDPALVALELPELAESAIAPLAAELLVRTLTDPAAADDWHATAQAFAERLGAQPQVLALADSLDTLLDSAPTAEVVGAAMHDRLLAALEDTVSDDPILAATRLEGALRVALGGYSRPFLVLDRLTRDFTGYPDDYRVRIPTLIGAALDCWAGDTALTAPLVETLDVLRADRMADAEAAFEYAMWWLRGALENAGELQGVVAGLETSAELFAAAVDLDEVRHDATIYLSVCRAVAAFVTNESERFDAAVGALHDAFATRQRWCLNAHLPEWRRPVLEVEAAWTRLVEDLRAAHTHLSEPSWLNAQVAVGQLARVYQAERTVAPIGGLRTSLQPIISNEVARSAVLRDQLARAIEADRASPKPALPPAADALLIAVQAVTTRARETASSDTAGQTHDDPEADPARASERVTNIAPGLLVLGHDAVEALAGLDDATLIQAGTLVDALAAAGLQAHPELARIWARICAHLERSPRFVGETAAAVTIVVKRTLTFLLDRYDRGGPIVPGARNIIRPPDTGQQWPHERDLQWEFYLWLASLWDMAGYVHCERSGVSTGRVDVIVRIREVEVVTEFKRELGDPSPPRLEQRHLAQAAQYSGSSAPFSQLIVLDLSDHSVGVPPLEDLIWVASHRATPASSPQNVVCGIVAGNRPSPSAMKVPRVEKG